MKEKLEELEEDRAKRALERGWKALGYSQLSDVRGEDRYLLGKWVRHQTRVRVPWLASRLGLKTRSGITEIGRRLDEDGNLKGNGKNSFKHKTLTDPFFLR